MASPVDHGQEVLRATQNRRENLGGLLHTDGGSARPGAVGRPSLKIGAGALERTAQIRPDTTPDTHYAKGTFCLLLNWEVSV